MHPTSVIWELLPSSARGSPAEMAMGISQCKPYQDDNLYNSKRSAILGCYQEHLGSGFTCAPDCIRREVKLK